MTERGIRKIKFENYSGTVFSYSTSRVANRPKEKNVVLIIEA